MQNPFDNPAFAMAEMTKAINLLPNRYGRIGQLNLFPERGVRTRQILVEYKAGRLSLLPSKPVGADGSKHINEKRQFRTFTVPHIPHDGDIMPDEYQGIRAFGSSSELQQLSQLMNDKLQSMRNKHAITLEHLRMGAVKGQVLDSDGSVIYDWFDEFKLKQHKVDFKLDDPKTEILTKCLEVLDTIEESLEGEFMTGIHALVSREFFHKLITHPKVKDAYERWRNGEALRTDMRAGFDFGGITFEQYLGQASDIEGNVRRFITKDEGHVFPLGTMDTFETVFAPADFLETANTIGQVLYSKQEARRFNRGIDIHTQSNPLPICYRPKVLVKLITS
jgi:hypothetical protein